MSNYTQTTFFTPKDSLPITDPNKTIFGAAYDVEFANLSAAMATKLDSVFTNPALISLNITGAATPANGFALPSANTLNVYTNSIVTAQFTPTAITLFGTSVAALADVNLTNTNTTATNDMQLTLTAGTSILQTQVANQNRATAIIATNAGSPTTAQAAIWTTTGIPLVFGTAGKYAGQIGGSTQGLIWGNPTGGDKGVGTINATGLFVNGVAVSAGTGAIIGTGAATLNASSIVVGQQAIVWRSATASIASNTTPTADAVLQVTNLPAGTYTAQAYLFWQVGAGGVQFVIDSAAGNMNGAFYLSTLGTAAALTFQMGVAQSGGGSNAASMAPSTSNENGWGYASIVLGGSSSIRVTWAQAISNAANSTIQPGSALVVTRVA